MARVFQQTARVPLSLLLCTFVPRYGSKRSFKTAINYQTRLALSSKSPCSTRSNPQQRPPFRGSNSGSPTANSLAQSSGETAESAAGAVQTSDEASGNINSAAAAADELISSLADISRQLSEGFDLALQTRVDPTVDACARCGKFADVCPVTTLSEVKAEPKCFQRHRPTGSGKAKERARPLASAERC
jgi:hypothetical protein